MKIAPKKGSCTNYLPKVLNKVIRYNIRAQTRGI